MPIEPTVYLGLGGTGVRVLLEVRQLHLRRYGCVGLPIHAFRVIDTDAEVGHRGDGAGFDSAAKFSDEEILVVGDPHAARHRLENPALFPHISAWTDEHLLRFVGGGAPFPHGAGQVRQLGRLAFFASFQLIRHSIIAAVHQVRSHHAHAAAQQHAGAPPIPLQVLHVVIVCSLAGGTGSGMVLDAAFFARALAHLGLGLDGVAIDTSAYLVLPSVFDSVAGTSTERERLAANGYAALQEIEHFSTIDPETSAQRQFECRWDTGPSLAIQGPPFGDCWLIAAESEDGRRRGPEQTFRAIADHIVLRASGSPFSAAHTQLINHAPDGSVHAHRTMDNGRCLYARDYAMAYRTFGLSKIFVDTESVARAAATRLSIDAMEMLLDEPTPCAPRDLAHGELSRFEVGVVEERVIGSGWARVRENVRGFLDEHLTIAERGGGGYAENLDVFIRRQIDGLASPGAQRAITDRVAEVLHEAIATTEHLVWSAAWRGGQGIRAATQVASEVHRFCDERRGRPIATHSADSIDRLRGALDEVRRAETRWFRRRIHVRRALEQAAHVAEARLRSVVMDIATHACVAIFDRWGRMFNPDSGEFGERICRLAMALTETRDRLREMSDRQGREARKACDLPDIIGLLPGGHMAEHLQNAVERVLVCVENATQHGAKHQLVGILNNLWTEERGRVARRPLDPSTAAAAMAAAARQIVNDHGLGGAAPAASIFLCAVPDPTERATALDEMLRSCLPLGGPHQPDPLLGVHTVLARSTTPAIPQFEQEVQEAQYHGYHPWMPNVVAAPGTGDTVLFVAERSPGPLLAFRVEIARGVYAYRQLRNDPESQARRHIDRHFVGALPHIEPITGRDATKHFDALKACLLGLAIGHVAVEANGRHLLRSDHRDPVSHRRVLHHSRLPNRGAVVERLAEDTNLQAGLSAANSAWLAVADPTRASQLLAVIEHNARAFGAHALVAERDALQAVADDVCRTLSCTTHASFAATLSAARATIQQFSVRVPGPLDIRTIKP